MDLQDISIDDEREKLFNEVWKEPMITVAKRYGLSDNGLRKRCLKLRIPLPPTGHWAKLQAGKTVAPQPELPPLYAMAAQQKIKESKQNKILDLIEIGSQSKEQLKALDGMELLTPESKERFFNWCGKIKVLKRIDNYHPLIIEYRNEIAYRKARDEEHRFRDVFRYFIFSKSKIEYRSNKAVLSISVSEKQINRSFRIIDTLIKSVKELDGEVVVHASDEDNATFRILGHGFSFQMAERMVKRRSLLSSSPGMNELKPMYEKVFNGILKIEFKEVLNHWWKDNSPKMFNFADSVDCSIEDQVGEMFKSLCKSAIEAKMAKTINDRERELIEKEQKRFRKIEEEKRKKLQQIEELNRRNKQHLINDIEQQMENWYNSQKLHEYADELEKFVSDTSDEKTKELLSVYITLVRQKADDCDPITDILNKVNEHCIIVAEAKDHPSS